MGLGISNFIAVESFKTSVKATIALFKVRDSVFLPCIVKFKEYTGFGNATGALKVTAAGTYGQVLQAGSDGTPVYASIDGGTY